MLARLIAATIVFSLAMPSRASLYGQSTLPQTGSFCQPTDSPQVQSLLEVIRRRVSSDVGSAPMWRNRLFEGKKMPPGAVMPVLEEAICEKVVQLLKADVAFADSTADNAAVVRVDGKYVARFWFRIPEMGTRTGTFYFDRGFSRVVTRSM